MNLTNRQQKLLEFVKQQHGTQVRKYTGEPYWHHLVNVAEIVSNYGGNVEAALCHDLFEDTKCWTGDLYGALYSCGYTPEEAAVIVHHVMDLTDCYTKEKYPSQNRAWRKQKEAERMGKIDEEAQTVKYADLIDNTKSIVQHDPKFAKVYLSEKEQILQYMTGGNQELRAECLKVLNEFTP